MILIGLLTGLIILLAGLYNGWIFRLSPQRDELANNKVHRIGGLIRALLMFIPILYGIITKESFISIMLWTLIEANLSWTGYDLLYNYVNNQNWWYSGNSETKTASVIDKMLYKWDEGIKLILFLYTIGWYWIEPYIQQSVCIVIIGLAGIFMIYRFKK
jgi:hypothetical protein